jgi:hypothetical protein
MQGQVAKFLFASGAQQPMPDDQHQHHESQCTWQAWLTATDDLLFVN